MQECDNDSSSLSLYATGGGTSQTGRSAAHKDRAPIPLEQDTCCADVGEYDVNHPFDTALVDWKFEGECGD